MITLNCKLCNEKMSSEVFSIDDVITCPNCWEKN